MSKEMLINVSAGEECRIALLEDGKLDELYMERTSNTSHVGNIYKGKVTNVEPSIQAAFVDFGIGRNGFLHISDLMPTYFGKKGENAPAEKVGQKLGRRDRPPIQQCLRKGDEIVVQIIKEGIGTKGPTLSTYLSVPGRVLVMMPGMAKMGVSKKIEDEAERTRLRKILDGLTPPKDCGFIIRTAGIGKSKIEIEKDLKYLARLWDVLKKQIEKDKPPVELYTEGDLITRTVRDVFTADVEKIVVDDKETAKKIKDFIKLAMPRTKNKVELYEDVVPLFHKYELETVIEGIHSRRVPLPSGGSLIIDQTEAVVAIDVNSGKFRDHSDAETTAFKTDMEAADEIARQLRLRDMGGVIICDFIDLRFERHRRELEERLFENLKKDRAKTRMLRMSQFGIVEMTRQRMRPSLKKAVYHECHACAGQGLVKTPESMALDVMRKLRLALNDTAVVRAQLITHPDVATFLQNGKRYEIAKLEQVTEKRVTITADDELSTDDTKFELFDARDGYVYIADLGMELPTAHTQRRDQPAGESRRGGRRDDRRRDNQSKAKHDRRDDDSVDAEEMFGEEGAEPKPAAKAGKPDRIEKPQKLSKPTEEIDEIEADEEANSVELDDAGDAMPGHAPDGFFDANDRDNRGRDRGNRNRNDRNRGPRNDNRGPRNDQRNEPRNDQRGDPRNGPRNEPRYDPRNDQRNAPNGGPNKGPPAEVRRPAPRPADAPDIDDIELDDEEETFAGDAELGEQIPTQGNTGDNRVVGGQRNDGPNGQGQNSDQPREGGGRRRRRRRGRRGRGRGPNGENQPSIDEAVPGSPADGPRDPQSRDQQPRDQAPRDQGQRDQQPRDQQPRDQGRRDQQPRRDDAPRQDERPRREPPRQPFRDQRRPYQGGGQGDNRRGSSRADLSHLAREASRQDAEAHGNAQEVEPIDHAEDEDASPGNDINFVPTPVKAPPARGARGGRRGGARPGRGRQPAAAKRTPPIEGLPNDEELDREAAELEAKLAKASKAAAKAEAKAEAAPAKASPVKAAPAKAARKPAPIKVPNVKPTGSTDSHLVDDQPADGDDVAPPKSIIDLDALPDYEDD